MILFLGLQISSYIKQASVHQEYYKRLGHTKKRRNATIAGLFHSVVLHEYSFTLLPLELITAFIARNSSVINPNLPSRCTLWYASLLSTQGGP